MKPVWALIVTVACAIALAPLPYGQAFADSGSLVAAQDAEAVVTDLQAAEETASYADISVTTRARTQGFGWGDWVESGDTAGDVSGKQLNALRMRLTGMQGMTGSISYRTYVRGSGWKAAVANGASTGSAHNVEALKIKLTGNVARHYDVLYRAHVSGKGWQQWVKNGAKSGITGKKRVLDAVQVKLSPKTEEAAGNSTEKVGIRYEARFKATGWQAWKGNGKTAGKAHKMLNGFCVKADTGSSSGGVKYRAYNVISHWTEWKTDGAFAGATANRLDAIEIKLTGSIAKKYDVWYRAYVEETGWLDWAKNGQKAGSSGFGLQLEAFQVKLVKKGDPAPGETQYRTVNQMERSKTLNGIDIASWQAGINPAAVDADFIIVKATGGTRYTNPYFTQWADATLASGKLLGLYHFAREASSPGSATAEARHFVNAVGPYVGKAMLFLDFEADALSMPNCVAWAQKFMDQVYNLTGVKPLIYTSKNVTRQFNWSPVASSYRLWVAQYPNYNTTGYQENPWTDSYGYGAWSAPTLFQYTSSGRISGYGSNLDLNKFYGSIRSWRKLQRAS